MREQLYWREGEVFVYEKLVFPEECGCVLLTHAQFSALPEYSTTIPTGVYVNKIWKSQLGHWTLREYTPHPTNGDLVRIVSRPIVCDYQLTAIANAFFWWLP